jgi:hypothetical protein
MDPAQMANEAVRRLQAVCVSSGASDVREGSDPIVDLFEQLAVLDGWAKIARDRVLADSHDARAVAELRRSCEQTARLHPHFIRRLTDALLDRPAVKTAISVPQQTGQGVALTG